MNEFIEQLHKDLSKKAKESMDGHYAMIEPIIIDWKHIEFALKASYKEGIRDAINICDEAIENDFSGALRNRTWIRNKLQQLKEQK